MCVKEYTSLLFVTEFCRKENSKKLENINQFLYFYKLGEITTIKTEIDLILII